jgi:serine/threonine protein kinase
MFSHRQMAEMAFTKLEEIGHEGKNSKVFKVHDHQLDALLVVKELDKAKFNESQFFTESQILYTSSHTNVVPIQWTCYDGDCVYIAMPYFENGSVNMLMNKRYLTVREIIRLSSQFLMGLHNVHAKNLIHFDIKPDNLLLSERMEAMLADFGLATQIDTYGLAGPNQIYLKQAPPEYFEWLKLPSPKPQVKFTTAFDIYQVGVTLYRMCNGNKEFYRQFGKYKLATGIDYDQLSNDVISGRFPNRSFFHAHIPEKLRKTIIQCLEVDPAQRYQSPIDIANSLADIEGGYLDWQFSDDPSNKKWVKNVDGRTYEMVVDAANKAMATKTMNNRTQRVTEYCVNSITESTIKRFLRTT